LRGNEEDLWRAIAIVSIRKEGEGAYWERKQKDNERKMGGAR